MEKKKIYTIGYTLFQTRFGVDVERLFQTLKDFSVNFLVDVRSVPYSKQYPQCNADSMKLAGNQYGVRYMHMPEVGAKASPAQDVFSKASDVFFEEEVFPISKSNRPEKTELRADEEIVDFNKFRHDDYFKDGLKRIETAYDKGFTLALMCSEKYPMDCHRYFLISRALEQKYGEWLQVQHIVQNKSGDICTVSNEELNGELKELIFKKNDIKRMDVLTAYLGEEPKINKYYGTTVEERINDFCDRYWNLIHGWKKPIDINNNYNNYD